ncbi:hypothetical protein SAMN05444344_0373 [Tenacibaculum mesophilum]|uniref:HNH endonuclease n=1 Tax=Tenacibaculum mesophilum TaxID=104268 RepID=A0ABM7CJ24_9FLAO|nr:hypothetical protein [Tenacibaculum mesophilum]AZJ33800.1 hypothetical protein D6200_14990 [Tenacibaculum mesophilum]QFS29041.1 hypothetical protein F9Y86_11790 [Tenacibaculum mesophilum]SHF53465.1 hypothetical protein SAMN05444344_0373 [Tenacibaculum mesophilum]
MIKIDNGTGVDLDDLAQDHFNNLSQARKKDGSYHASQSLIGRIQKQFLKDIVYPKRVLFWEYFLKNDYFNLHRVITGRPDELHEIINEIEKLIGNNLLSKSISYHNANLTSFGAIVKKVFNYETYRGSVNPLKYFEAFEINFCPYCNKEEVMNIEIVDEEGDGEIINKLHQLDHFYPRVRYPYLSLSFFNLIPGCNNCNAVLKKEKDFNIETHFNPFHKSFNDFFVFKIDISFPFNKSEIKTHCMVPHSDKTLKDLKITERYNQGTAQEEIFEMVKLFKNNSPKIQRTIIEQLKGLCSSVLISKKNLLASQGVPVNVDDINKKRLGKLKRDVCNQIGVI